MPDPESNKQGNVNWSLSFIIRMENFVAKLIFKEIDPVP